MIRSALIGVRVTPDMKDTLTKLAKEEDRTVASTINRIVRMYLEEHGHTRKKGTKQ